MTDQNQRDRLIRILDRADNATDGIDPWRNGETADAILADGWVRLDDATTERVARELWRQDYGSGVPFSAPGAWRHALYLNKARSALAALTNPSTEEPRA